MPSTSAIPLPQKLRSGVRHLRIKDWSVQNGVFLLGAVFADDFFARSGSFVMGSLALACLCLAFAYALNEYFDELQGRLLHAPVTSREIVHCISGFLLLSLAAAWMLSPVTFAVVCALSLAVWLHSGKPFFLKRHLFWRLFLNSLGFGLFFVVGASLDNNVSGAEALMGLFIFFLYLPLELIHVLAHMDSDREKGYRTLALVHGERSTIFLALVSLGWLMGYILVLGGRGIVSPLFAGWSAFNLLLLFLCILVFPKQPDKNQTYQQLRLRTKIVCAAYGAGMLGLLLWRL